MAIPHIEDIQNELLCHPANAAGGTAHCAEVYANLAQRFPDLSGGEQAVRYGRSRST